MSGGGSYSFSLADLLVVTTIFELLLLGTLVAATYFSVKKNYF